MNITINVFFGVEAPRRNKQIKVLENNGTILIGYVDDNQIFHGVDPNFTKITLQKSNFEKNVRKWFYIPEIF